MAASGSHDVRGHHRVRQDEPTFLPSRLHRQILPAFCDIAGAIATFVVRARFR
jgi:hypothetical protein